MEVVEGHAGEQAVAALAAFGVDVMFTLNGGHIWPFYEAARNQGVRVVDTRHEQSATFAAEALGQADPSSRRRRADRRTRHHQRPLGGHVGVLQRLAARRAGWASAAAPLGRGSLQELDHVPILSSITKWSTTLTDPTKAGVVAHEAAALALRPHRGPVFVDFPLDVFGPASGELPAVEVPDVMAPDPDDVARLAGLIAGAERPAFIVGSDVYWAGAREELAAAVEHLRVPVFTNGLGRGTLPADHELAFLRTRGLLKQRADVVVVVGTPLDFRLGFGRFGDADGGPRRRRRIAAGRTRRCLDGGR